MSGQTIYFDNARGLREKAQKDIISKLGGNYVVNESDLELRQTANASKNIITFPISENQGTVAPLERRVPVDDIFIVTQIKLGIQKMRVIKDANGKILLIKPISEILTHADPTIFVGVMKDGTTEAECVNAVYDAYLSLETNRTKRLNMFSTRNLKFIYGKVDGEPWQMETPEKRGYHPLTDMAVLNASTTTTFDLNLRRFHPGIVGDYDAKGESADTYNDIVLLVKGIWVENAAKAHKGLM
jgi:hypothetical protein